MYGWVVDKDHLDNKDVSVLGPRGISKKLESALMAGEGKAFRMFDDDNELYFSGRIIGDFDGFEPLDDYGEPGFGCTDIRYIENGNWESL
jgi:hypothetical protein